MNELILVLNAGSSSIKFSLFAETAEAAGAADAAGALELFASGQVEGIHTLPRFVAKDASGRRLDDRRLNDGQPLGHDAALQHIIDWLLANRSEGQRLTAVGHRVVHGGTEFAAPVRLDAAMVERLRKFVPLAPLHQPHNLNPITTLLQRAPDLPQVACFDTAMHRSNPPLAQMFALPPEITEAGVRRYGFHGLSYEYIASVLPGIDAAAARGRTLVLHLGNGASICALQGGRSIATTMGFTAVDGLPMGTRCGAIDPGVILYLMDERGMDARAIEKLIYSQSGLLGVSGVSSDMRTLLGSKEPRAQLAIDLYVYRIGRELGSLAAALGGLDAIVFTAGIGEHAAPVRAMICRAAAWLGVELDEAANAAGGPLISSAASRTRAWVIPTNEELMIARQTRDLLAAP
ncbi:MAG TPA: acetate/propionate family kinase [Rubrivivax sp.]|nr:acetate/propionate family kinase [Rubrivivax sp.]